MGFKLRSGNGPLQFKQMGSSPALHKAVTGTRHEHREGGEKILHGPDGKVVDEAGWEDAGAEERKIGKKGMKDKYILGITANEPVVPSTRAEIDAAKEVNTLREDALNTPGTREATLSIGTTEGQKKKQAKLDKIQQRNKNKLDNITGKIDQRTQELDALIKSGEGLEGEERAKNIAARDKLSNKIRNLSEKKMRKEEKPPSRREERLKKEVGMTAKEYEANQAKKAQTWQDDFMRASLTIPKGSDPADVIAFDESVRTRDARDETTKIDNAYKKLLTKTGAEAYEAKQKELSQGPDYTGDGTDINDESTDE